MKKGQTAQIGSRFTHRWIVASVILFLLLCFFALLGKVADASVPGDPLFGLDQALEGLGNLVTFNPQTRAQNNLDSFNERLKEVEQIVVTNDTNTCDPSGDSTNNNDSEHADAIITGLNLSLVHLGQVDGNMLHINNMEDKENIAAKEVERIVHHLLVLNVLSQFAPKQTEGQMVGATSRMAATLQQDLDMLPEGRRNDMLQVLPFQLDQVENNIKTAFSLCGGNGNESENLQSTGGRSQGGIGGQTGSVGSTRQTGNGGVGSTGTGGTGTGGTGTRSGGGGTVVATPTPILGGGLHINANTDSAGGLDVNVTNQGQVTIIPQPNPNTGGGTGADASVNDQKVVDTKACTGAQVFGVCL